MAFTGKISELKNGMINVLVEGMIRRKSALNEGAKGKYFSGYLFDEENNSIKIVAFKGAAVKWYIVQAF